MTDSPLKLLLADLIDKQTPVTLKLRGDMQLDPRGGPGGMGPGVIKAGEIPGLYMMECQAQIATGRGATDVTLTFYFAGADVLWVQTPPKTADGASLIAAPSAASLGRGHSA